MVRPDLGQFLQAAYRQLADAERAMPLSGARLDEAAGQLARLTAVLPRYLAITSASSTRRPWSKPVVDMTDSLETAIGSLAHWTTAPCDRSEWSGDYAGMIAAAADSLDAGHGLLRNHLETGPDGLPANRSWWGPVIRSPQLTTAILDEVTGLTCLAAVHVRHLASRSDSDIAAAALEDACGRLLRAADAGQSARWHTTGSADHTLLRAIPALVFPPRDGLRDGESEAALCAGIITTAERLRQAAWRSSVGLLPDEGGDAWHYVATAARIACHLTEVILRHTPDEHAGALAVAAVTAGRASAVWRNASAAWSEFRTDTLPTTTAVMTDASDLIIRLGRLTYSDPGWTPASGISLPPRRPDQARTVLAVVHHVADALNRLAAGDLTAIAATVGAGRLYALNRDGHQPSRYAKIGGQDAEILHETYLAAFDVTSRLAGHLDQIAISRATPSILLTKMRAAAPIPRDVIWQHHREPQPEQVVLGRFQAQMRQLGIHDPALLDRARQLDEAADVTLRRAALDQSVRHPTRRAERRHDTGRHAGRGD
jgi:hypothetical protein